VRLASARGPSPTGASSSPATSPPCPRLAAAAGSTLHAWGIFTPLRLLAAPFFGLFFSLAALFSPRRRERLVLLGAGGVELMLFATIVLYWITSL